LLENAVFKALLVFYIINLAIPLLTPFTKPYSIDSTSLLDKAFFYAKNLGRQKVGKFDLMKHMGG